MALLECSTNNTLGTVSFKDGFTVWLWRPTGCSTLQMKSASMEQPGRTVLGGAGHSLKKKVKEMNGRL